MKQAKEQAAEEIVKFKSQKQAEVENQASTVS